MNETKVTAANKESTMSMFMAFLEYALNKYMPILMVSFISIYSFGYKTWEPYFILGLMMFSNKFNFKCGYANCCIDNNIEDS
tara:strand:- start:236 stop:481 length:246 start_codon:yes stop_codon:yes gene_type:complete